MPLLWKIQSCDILMEISVSILKKFNFDIDFNEKFRISFEILGRNIVLFETKPDQEQIDARNVMELYQNSMNFIFQIISSVSLFTQNEKVKDMIWFSEGHRVSGDISVNLYESDYVPEYTKVRNCYQLIFLSL